METVTSTVPSAVTVDDATFDCNDAKSKFRETGAVPFRYVACVWWGVCARGEAVHRGIWQFVFGVVTGGVKRDDELAGASTANVVVCSRTFTLSGASLSFRTSIFRLENSDQKEGSMFDANGTNLSRFVIVSCGAILCTAGDGGSVLCVNKYLFAHLSV